MESLAMTMEMVEGKIIYLQWYGMWKLQNRNKIQKESLSVPSFYVKLEDKHQLSFREKVIEHSRSKISLIGVEEVKEYREIIIAWGNGKGKNHNRYMKC